MLLSIDSCHHLPPTQLPSRALRCTFVLSHCALQREEHHRGLPRPAVRHRRCRGLQLRTDEYVRAVEAAATAAWAGVRARGRFVVHVPALPESATDALRSTIQSDLLVGSGSSLPSVAALLSGKALFLNQWGCGKSPRTGLWASS